MFGKGKKEKDIFNMVESLTPEQKADLVALLQETNEPKVEDTPKETQKETATATNEKENVNEVATKTDDTNAAEQQSGDETPDNSRAGIDINDVMLKSEFQKYVESFEAKYEAVVKENKDISEKYAELENKNKELAEKYEKGSFGNYTDKSTNDFNEKKEYESAKDYFNKFFK